VSARTPRGPVGRPHLLVVLPATAALLFLALPVAALLWRGLADGALAAASGDAILVALGLSLGTTAAALPIVVVLGLPLAWLLARSTFRGKALAETLVDLPIVLPPSVAGLALLLAFGRRGVAGPALEVAGIVLPFTTLAVIVAQVFVALPFFVRATRAGLAGVAPELEEAAAIDGAGPVAIVRHVSLPVAAPAVAAGLLLAWARALGEFGATITFAGNIEGRTQTAPLAVYLLLESDPEAAYALSVALVAVCVAVLAALRGRWWGVRR